MHVVRRKVKSLFHSENLVLDHLDLELLYLQCANTNLVLVYLQQQ